MQKFRIKAIRMIFIIFLLINYSSLLHGRDADWMREARIYGLSIPGIKVDPYLVNIEIDRAIAQGANVIEADSRLSDYLPDDEFEQELVLIENTTKIIHQRGLKVVWYFPSLEVITANGVFKNKTMGKMHPDWVQIGFDRESPGIFYGQKEFWVGKHDESAWMCPNSPYREWYKARLRKLAKTGVDGLWLDVPLFGLIVAPWGCACPHCRAKFEQQTGLKFPDKFDVSDKRFWRYIQWRHRTLAEFIEDCRKTISQANPNTETIAEVVALDHLGATEWGTEGSALTGTSVVWEVDGTSETTAMADASFDDWMAQLNIYKYCRGATGAKQSWAFCYGFLESDAQLVMAGCIAAQNNPYELRVPKMTTSVGMKFKGSMYNWIARHSKQIFRSKSIAPVAVIYSARNRDFLDALREGSLIISENPPKRDRQWLADPESTPLTTEYMGDYRGWCIFLLQHQIPFDIYPIARVDAEILAHYKALILPNAASLTDEEKKLLLSPVKAGAALIISGTEPGKWDAEGNKRKTSLWADVRRSDAKIITQRFGKGCIHFWRKLVGRDYLATKDKKIRLHVLSWFQDAGFESWIEGHLPVAIQAYELKNEIVLHVLNYNWVGKFGNKPERIQITLSIPWVNAETVEHVIQSEPQWAQPRSIKFKRKNDRLQIPLELGINGLVIITKSPEMN